MDSISYSHSVKQEKRIKNFISDPDSSSGLLTQPKTIEAGESVTVPAGRVAILPDIQVNGEIVVEAGGEILVPSVGVLTKDAIVLRAPNNSLWAVKVSNTGILSTEVYNG